VIYGVDVSSYQPEQFPLNLPSNGKPVDFVIIKATEGTGYVNPKLDAQLRWARDHGLSVGFYHFARPGGQLPAADHFLAEIGSILQPGDHLWLDWEDAGVTNADKDWWLWYVKQQTGGLHRVGLYCNFHFWKNLDTTDNAGDALWIAQYGVGPGDPSIEHPWTIHQYTDSDGIDQNAAGFASRDAMKLWANPVPEGETPVTADTVMAAVLRINAKLDELIRRIGS